MDSGSSSAWHSGRRWVRPATICFAVLLFWACWPTPLPALTLSESELKALTENLLTADRLLTELESRLTTQSERSTELSEMLRRAEQRLSMLDGALQLWQEHSRSVETSLMDSQAALRTLRISLAELTDRWLALSQSWEGYRWEMRRQTTDLEQAVRRWRVGAVVSAVVGAVCGVLLGIALR